ncbi:MULTISPECIES: PrsW family glutamic-type intramembrane protease [unclassified Bacteroides]|uniref:PrsW family glutamic-type intramembrane protease n=1 Tax=unclassified Bacteroides TaxID=2646097 RepID=UPI0004E22BDB|nr:MULTISPECIES: PrsW family glutamic-type intramembrane protease [unclassified Bacteroides]
MEISVIRNNQMYGPYNEQTLLSYVNSGQILVQDQAIATGETTAQTVGFYLKRAGLRINRENKGNIISQLSTIGSELIFPKTSLFSRQFISDQRFLILALVGLLPMVIMQIPFGGFLIFYEVSLYFSIIWGLFFYASFNTPQVRLKTTLLVFFLSQAFVFIAWDLFGLPNLNPFYLFVDTFFPVNIIGYTLGVGLTEELVKLIPLLVILKKAKEPLVPQTLVYYGLMSGIAFGVYEGVQYQMTVNAEQEYDVSFFLNIARLTSLPFLHACWCGIAGYFLSFSCLYPKYRWGLRVLALAIPAIIHGLYDSFANFPIIPLVIVFFGLMLLTIYLKQSINYQSKLRQ